MDKQTLINRLQEYRQAEREAKRLFEVFIAADDEAITEAEEKYKLALIKRNSIAQAVTELLCKEHGL